MTPRTCDKLLAAFAGTVWLIRPEKGRQILEFLQIRNSGVVFSAEAVAARTEERTKRDIFYQVVGSTAVIPVHGIISQRVDMFTHVSADGSSTQRISQDFDAAMADKDVKAIVLDIDSPGGSSFGVQELSDKIYNARGKKPIISVVNSEMASAAYWIGSAADKIVATPSSWAGSVGVYMLHSDYSRSEANDGVVNTFIKAGKYKTEGNPLEPLSSDARDDLQQKVNLIYADFLASLTRNRGKIAARNNFGDGRMFLAKEALEARLIDEIGTLEGVVSQMQTSSGRRRSMEAMNREIEILTL